MNPVDDIGQSTSTDQSGKMLVHLHLSSDAGVCAVALNDVLGGAGLKLTLFLR